LYCLSGTRFCFLEYNVQPVWGKYLEGNNTFCIRASMVILKKMSLTFGLSVTFVQSKFLHFTLNAPLRVVMFMRRDNGSFHRGYVPFL
jgi:hypothetical protein